MHNTKSYFVFDSDGRCRVMGKGQQNSERRKSERQKSKKNIENLKRIKT